MYIELLKNRNYGLSKEGDPKKDEHALLLKALVLYISTWQSDKIRAFIGDEAGFQSLLLTRAARADGVLS